MGKLQDFQMKMSWNENMFMPMDIPIDIYHYTSPAGFESILFGNEEFTKLWASRYDCLNDSSEGTVAQERYISVCEKMLKSQELSKELYDVLVDVKPPRTMLMWDRRGERDRLIRPKYVRYICSFSKNPDSLAMWNYYSKGSKYEGFNLGFYSQSLVDSIEQQLQAYQCNVNLYPIVYEREQQETLIHDFIRKTIEHFEVGEEEILRYMASNQLLKWSLVFKYDCFKHEEEVRLIIDVGIEKSKTQKEIPQIPVYYRITNGYTVPYIKLSIEKDCLSYATIGPLMCSDMEKENQVAVLEERLSAGGYSAIGEYSKIPVRY